MVRHIVFWNLKDNAEGNDKQTNAKIIKEKLEALVGKIDGLIKLNVNQNYNEIGFDLCLYSEFVSRQSVLDYREHPLHKEVQSFVHKVISDRVVTDCEII